MKKIGLLSLFTLLTLLFYSCGDKYGEAAESLHGRLLCAANTSYDISPQGTLAKEAPVYGGADWKSEPKVFVGGTENIHAALLGRTNDGIVVAFRGTLGPQEVTSASIRDWLNNLMGAAPQAVPGLKGKVQKGFWTALSSIWAPLVQELKEMRKQGEKIFVTGHSKGGGIATLFALRLMEEEGIAAEEVVVFGSPKVLDAEAADYYASKVEQFSYETNTDLIPFVAPGKTFINLCAQIPVFGDLFAKAKDWDYEAFGETRLIAYDGKVGEADLLGNLKRGGEFVSFLTEGTEGLKKIVAAHSSGCGGIYFRALCPHLECPAAQ